MNWMLTSLSVFVAAGVADIFWAKYGLNVAAKNPIRSANWGSAIPLGTVVITLAFVGNPWYTIPYIMGCWVGSFLAVDHDARVWLFKSKANDATPD